MLVEAIWKPNALASCLHAAEASVRGLPIADPRLAEAIQLPAAQLAGEIDAASLPAVRFWRHLIPLAASVDSRRQLAEMAIVKTAGRRARFESIASAIAASIAAVETAVRGVLPNLAEELALRERPLREQWEARGPGMLTQIAAHTDENLIVPRCEILLVHPAMGGAGEAHLDYNQVRIEAVLANPVAELPEVVRLAWLIAQLHLDLPAYSEHVHPDRLPHIARFAMLPATLAAAEFVDLARCNPETIRRAIAAWRLAVPPDLDSEALIGQWWETYQQTRPPWPVALAALDQMFG